MSHTTSYKRSAKYQSGYSASSSPTVLRARVVMRRLFRSFTPVWVCAVLVLARVTQISTAGSEVLEEFAAGKATASEIALIVDAAYGNLNVVKEFWRMLNATSERSLVFGVLKETGFETRAAVGSLKNVTRTIANLERLDDEPNGTSSDLYRYLLTTLLDVPPSTDVILFTGRTTVDEPLRRACLEKLLEKGSRMFVLWTGNTTQGSELLRSLAEESNGSLEVVSDLLDEVSNDGKDRESGIEIVHERRPLSKMIEPDSGDVFAGRISEHEFAGEDEDKTLKKLGRVRFPEKDEAGTMNVNGGNQSLERQQSRSFHFIPLRVEVSSSSNLYYPPGSSHVIQYEVKNNLNVPFGVRFGVVDSQGVRVTNVQPQRAMIRPGETLKVDVNFDTLTNVPDGGEAGLTFSAGPDGGLPIVRKAIIRFDSQGRSDSSDPKVSYTYRGDCRGHEKPDTCDSGEWMFEATFQDENSGLKKVLTEPFGATFKTEFVAGTKSPVTIFYSLSCCQPKVEIFAEDGQGNYARRSLDVYNQGLLTGEIAAVVLGVLLLICVIIGVIAAVVIARRRKRSKLVIPRYQSGS